MNIQLIKAVTDSNNILKDKWYVPIELLAIGTYLKHFGYGVEILDGQHLSLEKIKSLINAPIVGLNFNVYSANCLNELVQAAKSKGALVIVGGQAATPLADQLLRGNPDIDAVVCYDGEESLRKIMDAYEKGADNPFQYVPNVVYRDGDSIIRNPIKKLQITDLPIPDRSLEGINIENYIGSFSTTNTCGGFKGNRVTNAHTKKGCPRRCSFCARIDREYRVRTPQQVFEEYRHLVNDYNVDYIFDHSDTWAIDIKWLEEFQAVCKKNNGFGARLAIFADLRDMTPKTIEVLKSIGVDAIETGIESGHEITLSRNSKTIKRQEIIDRVLDITNNGIKVEASYVLGILGEDEESAQATINISRELHDKSNGLVRNYFNIILPLPGTMIWDSFLADPYMKEKYEGEYLFDINELRSDYLRRHCSLGFDAYDYLLNIRNSILSENGLAVMDYTR